MWMEILNMIKWKSLNKKQFRYWKKWYRKKYLWNKIANFIAEILWLMFMAYYAYRVASGLDTGPSRFSVSENDLSFYREHHLERIFGSIVIAGFIIHLSVIMYLEFRSGIIRYLIEYFRNKSIIKLKACYCDVDHEFLEWFQENYETISNHETVTMLSANKRKYCHILCIDCRNAKNCYITIDFLFCYY